MILNIDHRTLNDIGSRTLHRRINGRALRCLAQHTVTRMNIGQVKPASKQRLDIPFFVGERLSFVHIRAHTWVFFEITLDVFARFASANTDLIRETKRGHPVN